MDNRADDQLGDLLLHGGAGHYTHHLIVDLAGDLVTGTLLSQIIYWFRPDKDGRSKLRVEREGRFWLAKLRPDWWAEIKVTPKQFDRSITILKEKGLVETRLWKFAGFTTLHIWLNLPAVVQGVKALLPKGENPFLPEVESAFDERGKPLPTETTNRDYLTETTYIPQGFTPSPLEAALFELPYWKPAPEADRIWLAEFSIEYPELVLAHVKACRDHWDGRRVSHKGQWKTRLRNWMRIERERKDRPQQRGRSTKERKVLPTDAELSEKAQTMGLGER